MDNLLKLLQKVEPILKVENEKFKEELGSGYSNNEKEDLVERVNRWETQIHQKLKQSRLAYEKATKEYIQKADVELGEFIKYLDDLENQQKFGDPSALEDWFRFKFDYEISELSGAYLKEFDKDLHFNMLSKSTLDWMSNWSKELGEIMHLNTHEGVKDYLTKGIEEGRGLYSLAEEMKDLPQFSRNRARATAITEVLTAHTASQFEGYKQSPAVTGKKWKHSGPTGIDPRPHHVAYSGTQVDVDEYFEIGGYQAMFPRDPMLPPSERVRCHCAMGPVTNPDIANRPVEERREMQQEAVRENVKSETGRDAFTRLRGTSNHMKYEKDFANKALKNANKINPQVDAFDVAEFVKQFRNAWMGTSTGKVSKIAGNYYAKQAGRDDLLWTVNAPMRDFQKEIGEDVIQVALQVQRQQTLEQLKDTGVTHVKVYRGVGWQDNEYPNWMPQELEASTITGRPLSSWTMDRSIAKDFAGKGKNAIFEAEVPIEQIFGLFDYGKETETMVFGDVVGAKVTLSEEAKEQYDRKVKKVDLQFQEKVNIPWQQLDWMKTMREED